MRGLALILSFCAIVSVGVLYYQTQQVKVPENIEQKPQSVWIEGLSYRQPELLSQEEVTRHAHLVLPLDDEFGKAEILHAPSVEKLVPVTKENVETLDCVLLGPIEERRLPTIRSFLERHQLLNLMSLMPVTDSRVAVYVGPLSKSAASRALKMFQKEEEKRGLVQELKNGGWAVVFGVFDDLKTAELWSRSFAQKTEMQNLRMTMWRDVMYPRVSVIFNRLSVEQANAVFLYASKKKISLFACPIL